MSKTTADIYATIKVFRPEHKALKKDAGDLKSSIAEIQAANRRIWDKLPVKKKIEALREVRESGIHDQSSVACA